MGAKIKLNGVSYDADFILSFKSAAEFAEKVGESLNLPTTNEDKEATLKEMYKQAKKSYGNGKRNEASSSQD